MKLYQLAEATVSAAAAAEPPSTSGYLGWTTIVIMLLIAASAFFSAAEIAIITLNDAKTRRLAEEGNARARLLTKFLDEPGRFFATIQFGNTLVGFLASALAANTFAGVMVNWFLNQPWCGMSAVSLRTIIVIVVTVIISFVVMVCGELLPKRIGLHYCEPVAMRTAGPLSFVARIIRPFVWFLNLVTNRLAKLFGISPGDISKTVSEEEIRLLVDIGREKGVIEAAEKEMIENVFEFNNKSAADIMVYRRDIVALPLDVQPEECRRILMESGFSRIPVYSGTIDDVVGILNVRDYFIRSMEDNDPSIGQLIRQPVFVPETIRADILFRDMQRRKQSIAIVLDEYGSTAGLVSLEDLLEEIVGDIYDEYDEDEPDGEWEQLDENTFRIRGGTAIDDVSDLLGVELPDEDYHTLGGLIFGSLSVIPSVGTILKMTEFGLLIKVEKMDGRRVDSVLVRRTPAKHGEDASRENAVEA